MRRKRRKTATFTPTGGAQVRWYLDSDATSQGQRVALTEIPFGESVYVSPMGSTAKTWVINGYVAGSQWMVDRDRLVAAFSMGRGTLIHPYTGKWDVVIREFRISERANEGGVIYVQVSCVEDIQQEPPFQLTSQSVLKALNADFINKVVEFLSSDALDNFIDQIDVVSDAIENQLTPFLRVHEFVNNLDGVLRGFKQAVSFQANEPGNLFKSFLSLIAGIGEGLSFGGRRPKPGEHIKLNSSLACLTARPEPLMQHAGLAAFALLDPEPPEAFGAGGGEARIDAYAVEQAREHIQNAVRAVVENIEDPELVAAAYVLEANHLAALQAIQPNVRRRQIVVPQAQNAILVAHEQAVELDDLFAQNEIPHPVFLAGVLQIQEAIGGDA